MRLDKFLSQMNLGSRNDVKELIRHKKITVNGILADSPKQSIDENKDIVAYMDKPIHYQKYVYYMLNKPQSVVSATTDKSDVTVIDLLQKYLPEQDRKREIVPAGRLDKDTEGLLLLTDDGALVHKLLSPQKHVNKTYSVEVKNPLTDEDIEALESGVDIGEAQFTLPARATQTGEKSLLLTIREGKFHQVKKMLQARRNQVISLKRVQFGSLSLDESLRPGECRALTEDELQLLTRANAPVIKDIDAVIFDLDGTLVDSIKSDWNRMDRDKYENEIPLKPGVQSFLKDLKKRGIKMGIATGNSRELVDIILKSHDLEEYFSCIKTGCEVLKDKPAPDIYLEIASQLQVNPEKCLVFEDILPGILAGRNAGMTVCAVEDYNSAQIRSQKIDQADFYIRDYNEVSFAI